MYSKFYKYQLLSLGLPAKFSSSILIWLISDGSSKYLAPVGHFLIQAISGEDSYVFLDETIQLGVPEADVWVDDQNKMHIVIRDVRTARYRVTDFVFDSEEKTFIGTDVLSGEGINYIGTTGK